VRLWALRHRCWHLPRERRTPWRAAGGGAAGRRGAAGGAAAKGGRPAQLAGGTDGNAEERKRDKTARGPSRGPSRRARPPGSGPKHGGRASRDVHWPVGRGELGWPRNRATVPDRWTTNPSRPWGAGGERARARVCYIRLCFIRVRRYGRGVQRQDNIFLAGRY